MEYRPPVFDADHFPRETKGISISMVNVNVNVASFFAAQTELFARLKIRVLLVILSAATKPGGIFH
jgi:hypothetical protein